MINFDLTSTYILLVSVNFKACIDYESENEVSKHFGRLKRARIKLNIRWEILQKLTNIPLQVRDNNSIMIDFRKYLLFTL